jgi:uncharacterized membrane protein
MNVNFNYAKTLAGEGSLLLLLGLVPYVGWILAIIGIVLYLRGVKELASYYQDDEIYQKSITGVKFYVVAIIAAAVAIAALVVGIATATGFTFTSGFVPTAGFAVGMIAFLGGLIIAFIFYILAALHLKRTFNLLAQKSGEASFATAGTLLWVGAILTIVVIGLLLILIAWIFATIGFFAMKSQQQSYTSQQNGYNQSPPSSTQPTAQDSKTSGEQMNE